MNKEIPARMDNIILVDYVDKLPNPSGVDDKRCKEWAARILEAAKGKTLIMYKEFKR
jgi:hypothetical protein